MGEWVGIAVNVLFGLFMAVGTGFATLFANNVRAGFLKAENDIKALYEKREADLERSHKERMADMERMLRELYEHKLDDTREFGEHAKRSALHDLRDEMGTRILTTRTEMTMHMASLRDDMRHFMGEPPRRARSSSDVAT